jgi:gamma-glutamylcyclotransferase (GGCT)/AIG2-like uncharacterized protein YtfP
MRAMLRTSARSRNDCRRWRDATGRAQARRWRLPAHEPEGSAYTAPPIFAMARRLTGRFTRMLLFVYGTLRRDAANHHELRDAVFIGNARTQPRYELVDMGGYPALLEGGADVVVGEVYEIDGALLKALDAFEDVPELYQRKGIAIDHAASETSGGRSRASTIEAYVMPRGRANTAPRLPNGDWITCSH